MELQRISGKHKNNKLLYYLKNYSRLLLPDAYYQKRLINKLKSIPKKEQEEILKRVNYYNKLEEKVDLLKDTPKLSSLKLKDGKTYFFDFREYTRYFKKHLKCSFLFGDIVEVPSLSISASWVGTAVVVVLLVAVEFVGTWLTSNVENVVAVIGAAGIGSVVTLCILTVSVLVIGNAAIVNGSVERNHQE